MKSFSLWPVAVSALLFSGCREPNEFQPPPPPEVTVAAPMVKDVTLYETFPGRVRARDSVAITARVTGFLEEIHFEDGAEVKAGDPLFSIEAANYMAAVNTAKAQLAQAEASRSLAEAALSRKKKAFEVQAVSELDVLSAEADLEAAEAGVKSAVAAVEKAELDLSYTEISAPMDGVMSDAAVSVGNLVGPGAVSSLSLLVRVDESEVLFSMDERRLLPKLRLLAENDKMAIEKLPAVRLTLADGSAYPDEGRIDFADNVVDGNTGTLQMRAVFDNPDRMLIDGMFARVEIPVPVEDALLVPETSILKDLVGSFVYTVSAENKVEATYIKTGALSDGQRIVTGGLERDARVVVKGIQRVRPGAEVSISGGAE